MLISADNYNQWEVKGHVQGQCMSHPNSDYMYVNIPKNASSWTKPNLFDYNWEIYNYRQDNLFHKKALVVLRDPVDRWISGIAEYLTLYHPHFKVDNDELIELIFDRVTFDDHTERQIFFLDQLHTENCIFFWFNNNYRSNFSNFIHDLYGPNKYDRYEFQHVSENSPERKRFKQIFSNRIHSEPKYLNRIQQYFAEDYKLIEQVQFYGTR